MLDSSMDCYTAVDSFTPKQSMLKSQHQSDHMLEMVPIFFAHHYISRQHTPLPNIQLPLVIFADFTTQIATNLC